MNALKNLLIKVLLSVYRNIFHQLQKLKFTVKTESDFELLSPKDDIKDKEYYENAIDWAVKNNKVKNLGIIGPYGSGKSSILYTYQNKHPEHKFLNISLGSFKGNTDEKNTFAEKEANIEKSILQQIFYKVRSERIPNSRFRRIKKVHNIKSFIKVLGGLILILASLFFIIPNQIKDFFKGNLVAIDNIICNKDISNTIKGNISAPNIQSNDINVLSYFIFSVFGILFIFFIYTLYKYLLKNIKVSKIKFDKLEAELCEKNSDCVFNKHIDEILYYFETIKYDVVLFEDLDRFENKEIFIKLRELNALINNSEQIKQNVLFIYALKDELLIDKDRIKFFDFIIPVIPFINSSNSNEIITAKVKQLGLYNEDWKDFINTITIYIDDMRLLNNIFNEFQIFQKGLKTDELQSSQIKLFSILIYKNIYPQDFEQLYFNKGLLYTIINKKSDLAKLNIACLEHDQAELNAEILKIENEQLKSIDELKSVLFGFLYKKYGGLNNFTIFYNINEHESYSINNFFVNFNFDNLNTIKKAHINGLYLTNEVMDELSSFYNRYKMLNNKNSEHIKNIEAKIKDLNTKISEIKNLEIRRLLTIDDLNEFEQPIQKEYTDFSFKKYGLLKCFLLNGYIDETYENYISYFYPGSLTQNDKIFFFNVKENRLSDFRYALSNIENILDKLALGDFSKPGILNINLFEFILKNEKYQQQTELFLDLLSNESQNSIDFIDTFLEITDVKNEFVKRLCGHWQHFAYFIINSVKTSYYKQQHITNIIKYAEIHDVLEMNVLEIITNFIAEQSNLLGLAKETIYLDKIAEVFINLEVKFISINYDLMKTKLAMNIYENNLYQINLLNINNYLLTAYDFPKPEIQYKNYSCIQKTDCMKKYINLNIQEYIEKVYFELDQQNDDEMIIKSLLENDLPIELKHKIIEHESTVFSDISIINDKELWGVFIGSLKAKPTWGNVINYYITKNNTFDDRLIKFMNCEKNYIELSKTKFEDAKIFGEEVYTSLSLELIINTNVSENAFIELSKSISKKYDSFDTSSVSAKRMINIIHSNVLNFAHEIYVDINRNHKQLVIYYIEKNKEMFLENLNSFERDEYILNLILKSNVFDIIEKIGLIETLPPDFKCLNNDLAKQICDLIDMFDNKFIMNKPLYFSILTNNTIQNKNKLFNNQLEFLSLSDIYDSLIYMGSPYSDIPSATPTTLDYNPDNVNLIQGLKSKNQYISSCKKVKSTIRIYKKQENKA